MTESMPPTQVQMQAMQRALAEAVLDRACEDPQFKQQLIEDPQLAMRQANFPEAQEIQQVAQQQSEVQGQWWPGGGGGWAAAGAAAAGAAAAGAAAAGAAAGGPGGGGKATVVPTDS